MLKKPILVIIIFTSLNGCKKYTYLNNEAATIEATTEDGGQFITLNRNEYVAVLEEIYKSISLKMKLQQKEIFLLDVYENKYYYIWYTTNLGPDNVYRFIADKNCNILNYSVFEKEEVLAELKYFKK